MSELHLETVIAIEKASFSRPWTARHFLDEIESPNAHPLVAVTPEGEVVGYLCPKVIIDEGEILDVAVDGRCRGKKVGRLLVEAGLSWCRAAGALSVALEVRLSNDPALALYRHLGFVEEGRRKGYYDNGEDAVLMRHTFTSL